MKEIGVVPAGLLPPPFDAASLGLGMPEQVQGNVAQDGEVLGGIPGPNTALILLEVDIEDEVDPVLNAPVAAHRLTEGSRREDLTAEIGAVFAGPRLSPPSPSVDPANRDEPWPGMPLLPPHQDVRISDHLIPSRLDPSMPGLDGLGSLVSDPSTTGWRCRNKA